MESNRMPLALRLTGCWLLWSAWCSVSAWGLSAIHQLSGWGHLAALPVLLAAIGLWLRATAPPPGQAPRVLRFRSRWWRPLRLIYLVIVGLSLLSALLNPHPWSVDAAAYRLPRLLYWWSAHHWFWIGTLDHRLDFSSCGYEWQALPIIEATHSDRFLFLINFVPYLLMPALVFSALRTLGVAGRSAARWMWLLPAGYCYALQCSGLQNDGYAVNYTLAALVFATAAVRRRQSIFTWLAVIAAALLTGTKLSNLPLLLPLGLALWPALRSVKLLAWRTPLALTVAALCSFLPLALLSLKYTGDWTGDPTDQWDIKVHNPVGGVIANLILLANDAAQLPVMPGASNDPAFAAALEQRAGPFFAWLKHSHGEFSGIHFGQMPYEAKAGLGFGLGAYVLFVIAGCAFVRVPPDAGRRARLPVPARLILAAAWISFAAYLSKLGSYESARIAAPYYPLLFASLLGWPRAAWLERKKFYRTLAWLAALSVLPVIILTPARPLAPVQALARLSGKPALQKAAAQYRVWNEMSDDLAPLRNALPPDAAALGYGGGFADTSYGFWKPFGRRTIVELGLPAGSHHPPPPALRYAVVTDAGLQQRYAMDLKTWLKFTGGSVIFQYQRSMSLDSRSAPQYELWYLVKFN